MAVHYTPPERGWTKIPDELIDADMTFAAIGVLAHMLKNRADWEEPIWRIAQKMRKGKHQITAAIKDLEKHGYARQTVRKTGGNLSTKGWDFAWPAFTDEKPRSPRDTGFRGPEARSLEGRGAGDRGFEIRGPGAREVGGRGAENRGLLEDCVNQDPVDQDPVNDETLINQDSADTDTPSQAPAHPTEEAPRVLRNFNGYQPPSTEPAPTRQTRTSPSTDDPDFDQAWELYGYKTGRAAALKAWTKAVAKTPAETILAAIPAYVTISRLPREPERRGVTIRAHFSTWLNQERWEDEIEPPKKGYQGQAGSDLRPRQEYEDRTKHFSVPKLMKDSAFAGQRQGCYAWYWHWNRAEQADWTIEQLVEFGNTPDDAEVLYVAFRHGPPEHWIDSLAEINIKAEL